MVEAGNVGKPEQLRTAVEQKQIAGDDAKRRVRARCPRVGRLREDLRLHPITALGFRRLWPPQPTSRASPDAISDSTSGSGTAAAKTATHPPAQAVLSPTAGVLPASGTKTSPVNGSTAIE